MYYLLFGCCFFSRQYRARRFWIEVQPLHLWQRGCIFLHYLHWFNMIFMIRHYFIDTRLMQIRPACPASTTNMSSTTSIRPRLLFLANFIDFCELGHSSGISLSKLRGCHKYQDRRGPEECQNLRSLNVMRNVRTHVLGYQEGHIFLWCWVPSSSWYFVWTFFVLYWQNMKFGTFM